MSKQDAKAHAEEMINRVYGDLAWDVRSQMIAAAFAAIEWKYRK